jgi:hypothetical protein
VDGRRKRNQNGVEPSTSARWRQAVASMRGDWTRTTSQMMTQNKRKKTHVLYHLREKTMGPPRRRARITTDHDGSRRIMKDHDGSRRITARFTKLLQITDGSRNFFGSRTVQLRSLNNIIQDHDPPPTRPQAKPPSVGSPCLSALPKALPFAHSTIRTQEKVNRTQGTRQAPRPPALDGRRPAAAARFRLLALRRASQHPPFAAHLASPPTATDRQRVPGCHVARRNPENRRRAASRKRPAAAGECRLLSQQQLPTLLLL